MFYPFSYIISYLALNDACSIIGSTNKFFDTCSSCSSHTLGNRLCKSALNISTYVKFQLILNLMILFAKNYYAIYAYFEVVLKNLSDDYDAAYIKTVKRLLEISFLIKVP